MAGATITEASIDIPSGNNAGDAKPDALATATSEEGRPAWLPEGFATVEAYVEAANAAGVKPPAAAGEKAPESKPVEGEKKPEAEAPKVAAPQTAEEVSKQVGFDVDPFAKEFAEKGALSDESYKALSDKGFNKEMVDTWIAGQQAIVAGYEGQLHTAAGGKAEYDALIAWAGTNMTPAEVEAFNSAVLSRNVGSAQLAIRAAKAAYEAKEGREARLVSGGGSAAQGDTFAKRSDQAAAMADPRYRTDAAYRAAVQAKSMRSKFDAG